MSRPSFKIMVNGRDITEAVGSRKMSMSITETTGTEADTLSFEIDDADGIINIPKTGVEAQVFGGFLDGAWRDFGIFVIDEVTLSGYPMKVSVNGQSVAMKEDAKGEKTKAYQPPEFKTYGDVFTDIARRNSLTLSLPQEVQSKPIEYEAQQNESDTTFASRLSQKLGAMVSIKNKHMVVARRGYGASASGQRLPEIVVARGLNLLDYSVSLKDSTKYSRVKATYFDRGAVERKEVQIPSSDEGPDYTIREPFQSEEEALNAASTKADDLRRGTGTASFSINGAPFAMAEAFVVARSIREGVNGLWRASSVTHDWDASGGYTTSIECEQPGDKEATDDGS